MAQRVAEFESRLPGLPDGGGMMGALMRAHDWSKSPLDWPSRWPQSLRLVVGLLLNSKFPMFVAWGDELGFLYNDSYAAILGEKHPAALGARFRDIWGEIWPDISPLIDAALAGEATYRVNLPLLMRRHGYDEQTWFTFSYSPVFGEDGAVAGMFCACTETTAQVLSDRRRDALLRLDARLRDVPETADLSFAASEVLGEVLGAMRVGYGTLDPDARTILVERNWGLPGVAEVPGLHQFSDYGTYIDALLTGTPVANSDTDANAQTAGHQTSFQKLGIRAHLDVPVVEAGRAVAEMFVHSSTPRHWSDEEIAFVRDFAERTHAAIARRKAEKERRDSDARYRTLFETIDESFAVIEFTDPEFSDYVHVEANRAFEANTGIADVVGRRLRELVSPAEADEWAAIYRRVVLAGEAIRFERELLKTGRHLELAAFPIQSDGRDQVAVLFKDVSARRRAEAAVRESEQRFRLMADAVPQIVWITDRDGRIEFLNRQFVDYTGADAQAWTPAEMAAQFIHSDDGAYMAAAFSKAREAETPFELELRIRSAQGEDRWFLARAEPYRDAVSGEIVRWFGASVDIHERKDAEARLRALNDTLEEQVAARSAERDRLWSLSQDMLARADYSGMMSAVSPAWEWVLGWRETELLSRGYSTFMHPDDMGPTLAAIAEMAASRQPTRFENRIATRDGGWKHIEWTVAPEPDGQNFIAVGRDLTPVKAREAELNSAQEALRQSQKMEAMGSLTGGVAHDFNNLLTPIIGSLDLLMRKGARSERETRLIDGALQSAERAKTLFQRLLAFARRQPLQPVAVDLNRVVRDMVDLLAATIGPSIHVTTSLPADLPPVRGDTNQLEMALLNLAVNARDAMPEGGDLSITARIETASAEHPASLAAGVYVGLAISDSGKGMDAETQQRAVEPFFSTKGVGKGTGLGLSMVHGLAAQLGGGIAIDSAPGRGTTITLWLPVSSGTASTDEVQPDQPVTAMARGTLLVVDDEALVRESTAEMLIDLGFEVLQASSAEEAMDLLRSGKVPDLLVSDHLMPGMTGADLAVEARRLQPGLPVLILSGYAELEGIAPGLPWLTKPFRLAELAASLSLLMPDR